MGKISLTMIHYCSWQHKLFKSNPTTSYVILCHTPPFTPAHFLTFTSAPPPPPPPSPLPPPPPPPPLRREKPMDGDGSLDGRQV